MPDEDKANSDEQMRTRKGEKIKWTSVKVKDNEEVQTDEEGYCHGLWISKFPNGKPKLQETYVHGIQHGPFTTWHENGQKASEGAYQNGDLHGPHTLWYENGQKHEEIHYVEGERKGSSTQWYPNGQIASELVTLKQGVAHGILNTWHPNGQKWVEGGYVYGTPHGPWTERDDQGRLLCQRRFVAGVQYGCGTRFFTTPLSESMSRQYHLWRQLIWMIVLVAVALAVWRNDPDRVYVVLGVLGLIVVHELGHFTLAKLAGIPIEKFVVGFGPKLAAVLYGHTLYELRMIPLFGYVQAYSFRPTEFAYYQRASKLRRRGEPPADDPAVDPAEEAKAADEYVARPARLAFLLGGVTFNILTAFLIIWFALIFMTGPSEGSLPFSRSPLTAAKILVDQSLDVIGGFVPPVRSISRPDSAAARMVLHNFLGIGGKVFVLMSICLGLLNLLPIYPLDGFKALRISIEMVIRRPVPKLILYPIMIAGFLLVGADFVVDTAYWGIATVVSVFNIDMEKWAERSREPVPIVGQPTGAFVLERNLKLFDGKSSTDIKPKTGNQFLGLQFHLDGVKTLVCAEYPIEDPKGKRYSPLGAAFGLLSPMFNSRSFAGRVELRLAAEGLTGWKSSISFSPHGPKLEAEELSRTDIILLYEVPEDAAQFQLRHHELDYGFKPEKNDSPPVPGN